MLINPQNQADTYVKLTHEMIPIVCPIKKVPVYTVEYCMNSDFKSLVDDKVWKVRGLRNRVQICG